MGIFKSFNLSDSEILDYMVYKDSKKGSAAQVFELLLPFPRNAVL